MPTHYTEVKSLENVTAAQVDAELGFDWVLLGIEQWKEADEDHWEIKTRYIIAKKEEAE